MSAALTRDGFLGGRLTIVQPAAGYRAGVDSVLLAAAVPAAAGDSVLELGCGAGTALLCLGRRVAGLDLCGVELQPAYAQLARDNAAAAGLPVRIAAADIAALPGWLKARRFDQVVANPPYFDRRRSVPAPGPAREAALGAALPLADWVEAATRRLAPGGQLTMIQRADRLPELLSAVDRRVGSSEILPLVPRAGRAARAVILRARKGGRADFRLLAPLVLHRGAAHGAADDAYAPEVERALRDGAALPWGC